MTSFAVGTRGTCPDAHPYPFSADGVYLHRCCSSALGHHTLPRTQSLFESCDNDDFVSCSEPPCQASSCIDGEVFGVPCKALDVCQFGCSNQLCTLREVPVLALDGSATLLQWNGVRRSKKHARSRAACAARTQAIPIGARPQQHQTAAKTRGTWAGRANTTTFARKAVLTCFATQSTVRIGGCGPHVPSHADNVVRSLSLV